MSIDNPHICETRSRKAATQKLGVLILLIIGFNFGMKNHVISHQLGGQLTRSNMSRTWIKIGRNLGKCLISHLFSLNSNA